MKSRKYLLTINNPLDHGITDDKIKQELITDKTKYMCYCHEIGEKGTPHVHVYVVFENPRDTQSIMNKFNMNAHIDIPRGNNKQNRDYIRKEGEYINSDKKETNQLETFYEFGELPPDIQGKRNDIIKIAELIKDGNTPKDIINEYPQYSFRIQEINHLYEFYRWDYFKVNYRTNIEVTFIYGYTGTGKTSYVMNKHGIENVYQVTDYKHPFDNYDGQDVILFDEFRSDIECKEMLKYLDIYPVQLPCRYSNKWACYTKVYIVSNLRFERIYEDLKHIESETLKAFKRRIHHYIVMEDKKIFYEDYHAYYADFGIDLNDYEIKMKSGVINEQS